MAAYPVGGWCGGARAVVVVLAVDLPVAVSIALVAIVVIAGLLAWRSTRPAEVTG